MATYFWVGGAGTWDNATTTNWAASTGGAGGAGVPTNADTATFDGNSGAGDVSVAATAASLSTTLNNVDINLTLAGSPTLCAAAGTLTLTTGSVTLNTFTLTIGRFSSSNSNTRAIAFGTGNITLTGNAGSVWSTPTDTNLSVTGTAIVNSTYSGATGTRSFSNGATTVSTRSISVNISAGTDTITINNFNNIDFTGFSGTLGVGSRNVYGNLTFSAGMTCAAGTNGTNFAAASGTQQVTTNGVLLDFSLAVNAPGATVQLQDNLTMGANRAFTLTAGALDLSNGNRTLSAGSFVSSNTNTRSIAFGTGQINITNNNTTVWNTINLTSLTLTGTPNVNFTYAGGTGTRTIAAGTTSPTSINTFNINVTAGTDLILMSSSSFVKNLNFTGFSGALTTSFNVSYYGDLTFSATMTTPSMTSSWSAIGTSGTQQITTNGKTIDLPLVFNGIGGTFAFQDALTQGSTRAFTITNGTVQLKNSVTSTVGSFATSGTNQKFLQSTTSGSQATLSQASGTVNASYLTIRDINATGGATWNAYVNQFNSDAGNVDGWDFGISPVVGGAEYTYALRSLTELRRF